MPSNTTYLETNATVLSSLSLNGSGATLNAGAVVASSVSVGTSTNTGTAITAMSSIQSTVGVFVVQGSASSFTWIAWPAVKAGDWIITTPAAGAGASSISSGLVPHSHCTAAGTLEFRLSNVSTLAASQTAQTWNFLRISTQ